MSPRVPASLPWLDRRLLNTIERIVPPPDRGEWSRAWQAELWYVHHNRKQRLAFMADLAIGLSRDAMWLRTESWRVTLNGTAALCLGSLAACSLLCTLAALVLVGSWQALFLYASEPFGRCLAAAPLIFAVGLATASGRHVEQTAGRVFRFRRVVFFTAKIAQMFSLAFLLSIAACFPLHPLLPRTTDLFQMFGFVLLAVVGMRWALHDQEQRCKRCLQSLAKPARVGRPSRNLLEWNGTEMSCKQGHGLLSVPEMETSWCRSSHWVEVSHS